MKEVLDRQSQSKQATVQVTVSDKEDNIVIDEEANLMSGGLDASSGTIFGELSTNPLPTPAERQLPKATAPTIRASKTITIATQEANHEGDAR